MRLALVAPRFESYHRRSLALSSTIYPNSRLNDRSLEPEHESWVSDLANLQLEESLKPREMAASSAEGTSPSTFSSATLSEAAREGDDGDSCGRSDISDVDLGFVERAVSAAGAAVISAIVVNPLDIAKTRLQAQAAGVSYNGVCRVTSVETNTVIPDLSCIQSYTRTAPGKKPMCPPDCFQYKGTLDVFYQIVRQEGFLRLWRGTNASLALAVPTVGIYLPLYDIIRNYMEEFSKLNSPSLAPYSPLFAGSVARSLACISCYPIELARTRMQAFKEIQAGKKPPGVWKTLTEVIAPLKKTTNLQGLRNYRILWTGLGAQLARDVPFSGICWSTLEPIKRRVFSLMSNRTTATSVFGANFCAGFVAGSLAAAATCPLDVVKTRRQIEKDPSKALRMTTRLTLAEIWRDGGVKGMFAGVGPRVARAGPSVGIVVSFYEVMKYCLHQHRHQVKDLK